MAMFLNGKDSSPAAQNDRKYTLRMTDAIQGYKIQSETV